MFKSKLQYMKCSELNYFLALSALSKFTCLMVPSYQTHSVQTLTARSTKCCYESYQPKESDVQFTNGINLFP